MSKVGKKPLLLVLQLEGYAHNFPTSFHITISRNSPLLAIFICFSLAKFQKTPKVCIRACLAGTVFTA